MCHCFSSVQTVFITLMRISIYEINILMYLTEFFCQCQLCFVCRLAIHGRVLPVNRLMSTFVKVHKRSADLIKY